MLRDSSCTSIEDPNYFRKIPWCSPFINDEAYQIIPGYVNPVPKVDSDEARGGS